MSGGEQPLPGQPIRLLADGTPVRPEAAGEVRLQGNRLSVHFVAGRAVVDARGVSARKHGRCAHLRWAVLLALRRPYLAVANLLAQLAVLILKAERYCLNRENALLERRYKL